MLNHGRSVPHNICRLVLVCIWMAVVIPGIPDNLWAWADPQWRSSTSRERLHSVQASGSLAQPEATDWPMLGHDLARTGATADQVNNSSQGADMSTVWLRDFASASNPKSELINFGVQPIVAQGIVYVPTMSNRLHALDADTGETEWVFDAGEPGAMVHSPAVVDGVVYVGSTDGYLYAVDVATGQQVWRFAAGRGGFGASPAVTADTVYIGGRDGVFYAIRTSSGTSRWTLDVGAPIMNSAAVDEGGGYVYFGAENMRVYKLNTTSGSLVWQTDQLAGRSFRHYYPVLVDDKLIIRTNPAMESHYVLQNEDDLILQAAGRTNHGDKRAICDEGDVNIHASWSQSGWNAEINAIRSFLDANPEYQTWHVLDVASGEKAYTVPILWSGGSGHVGEPPVLLDQHHVIGYIRSYYSNYDACDTWYLFGGFGKLDVRDGSLSIVNLASEPSSALWIYGIGAIGDEQNTPTLGGEILYVTSHGDTVGGVNVSTGAGVCGMVTRDRAWGLDPRNLPFMGELSGGGPLHQLPSPREGAGGVVPYGNRLYWATMSTVGAMGGTGGAADVGRDQAADGVEPAPSSAHLNASQDVALLAPPLSQLESYVTETPEFRVNMGATADLRAELEEQISDFIATRHAPMLFTPGKAVMRFYFQDPADVFYTLSIALPYLSPSLQDQVKSCLAQEWADHNPLTDRRYPLSEGQRREWYPIDDDMLSHAYSKGTDSTPSKVEILYAVWAYAHYGDRWDVVAENWDWINYLVTSAIDPANPSTLLSDPTSGATGSVNRRTSALIAYTRMAEYMGDDAAYAWGLDAATRSLAARIDHEVLNRPAIGEWHTTSSSGGKFVYRSGSHNTWIPRYRDLTPEIGAALRDHATADLADQAEYLRIVRPTWYVAWGPQVFAGEVSTNFPQHAMDIFNAQAMALEASPNDLRLYLDRPWCHADLYYMQKLVHAIRASAPGTSRKEVSRAAASNGNTLTYSITLVGSGEFVSMTDRIPDGTAFVSGSESREPDIGTLSANDAAVSWSGTITEGMAVNIAFAVTVVTPDPQAIVNQADVDDGSTHYTLSATTLANGLETFLPIILGGHQ